MKKDKSYKKLKKFINISVILGIIGTVYLIQSIIYFKQNFIFLFILGIIFIIIDYIYIYKFLLKNNIEKIKYTEIDLKTEYDIKVKKSINWIFIFFIQLIMFTFSSITLIFNSKIIEILELFNYRLLFYEIIIFMILKNILNLKFLFKLEKLDKKTKCNKEIINVVVFNIVYFIITTIIYFVFEKVFVLSPSSIFVSILSIITIIYNYTRINKIRYKKKKPNKIALVIIGSVITILLGYSYLSKDIWLVQPYINSISYLNDHNNKISYDEKTGIYTITKEKDDFKILQLTDIHLGGSALSYDKDLKALKTIYSLLERKKPDFVIVTGDLTFPVGYASFSLNNKTPVEQFAAFMRNTGIPWAFTYGNHDTESYATTDKSELNKLYKSLSYKTSRTLLYPYIQPNITGRNNQFIELRNSDNTLNQALFLIDSNAYTDDGFNKYDYIHDDQVDWYKENIEKLNKEENKTISSLIFFHMPLQEYETAYNLYQKGSNEVKYYFGSNDEKMIDKICDSEYPSKLFNVAAQLKSTKGMFCGHDHYNNMSLEYKGIRLTYGMSIDYLAMPGIARDTKQRGATLITAHKDSTIDIEQIPYKQ